MQLDWIQAKGRPFKEVTEEKIVKGKMVRNRVPKIGLKDQVIRKLGIKGIR